MEILFRFIIYLIVVDDDILDSVVRRTDFGDGMEKLRVAIYRLQMRIVSLLHPNSVVNHGRRGVFETDEQNVFGFCIAHGNGKRTEIDAAVEDNCVVGPFQCRHGEGVF